MPADRKYMTAVLVNGRLQKDSGITEACGTTFLLYAGTAMLVRKWAIPNLGVFRLGLSFRKS